MLPRSPLSNSETGASQQVWEARKIVGNVYAAEQS